jgi:phosphate-selective porin
MDNPTSKQTASSSGVFKVHPFKITTLTGAVLIALSSASAQAAQPSNEIKALKGTVEELRQQLQTLRSQQNSNTSSLERAQVDELRKQLNELRALVSKQQAEPAPTAVAGTDAAEGESQESVDARTAASKADVQGLRTDLENYKYDQSRLQERTIPSVTRNTKLGGTITLGYETRNPAYAAGDSQTTAATNSAPGQPRKTGFRAPTAALTLTGNLYRDYGEGRNLTYRLGLNVGTTPTNATANSQVNLTDAWIRYSYEPSSGNLEDRQGTITLGQQAVPFGLDAPALDPEVRAVINSALFVTGLDVGTRQVGVLVQGDFDPYVDFTNNYRAPLLAYSLGLFNGNGPNKNDNNSARDWIARAAFTLPVDYTSWLRQLQIGATYYKRNPTIAPNSTTTTITGYEGSNNITGFDLNWTHLPYSLSYEWARGKGELSPTTANLAANPDRYKRGLGQYINLGYTFGEQFLNSSKQQGKFDDYWPTSFQAFLRIDSFDPNLSSKVVNDKQYRNTLGLNVFFAETTRLQINYFKDRNQAGTNAQPKRANGLQAQFVAGF